VLCDIVVYDGLDELDALGPLEVLRRAARAGAAFSVRLVTPDPPASRHRLERSAVPAGRRIPAAYPGQARDDITGPSTQMRRYTPTPLSNTH
jgi:putative intracellular protease/amidase